MAVCICEARKRTPPRRTIRLGSGGMHTSKVCDISATTRKPGFSMLTVSIVVPLFGLTSFEIRMLKGNPKKEPGDYRYSLRIIMESRQSKLPQGKGVPTEILRPQASGLV